MLVKRHADLIDPDSSSRTSAYLAGARGIRSSLLVTPTDGQMPYTEKGLVLVERAEWMDTIADDNPVERTTFDRCLAGLGQPPIRQIPPWWLNTFIQTPREIVILTEDVASLHHPHRWIIPAARRDDVL